MARRGGKTTLAASLAKLLPAEHLKLDDFVAPKQDTYVAAMRLDDLCARLGYPTGAQTVRILDGVCIATILDLLNTQADATVYVKRVSGSDHWSDERLFHSSLSAEQVIGREEANARQVAAVFGSGSGTLPALHLEVIGYHHERKPHENADYVFRWTVADA